MSLMRTRALLCALALLVLSVPLLVSAPAAQADIGSKTVEGKWHPWNPVDRTVETDYGPAFVGASEDSKTPSVTVDQTSSLGDQVVNVSWRNFTPTSNLGGYGDENGKPSPLPLRIQGSTVLYGVNIYQCRGSNPTENPGTVRNSTNAQCYNAPIVGSDFESGFGPNNTVQTVTQNDGTGFASFHVENATSNDLLRCSSRQPCSIVVVPNQGGDQPYSGNSGTSNCDDHSQDIVQPDPDNLDNSYTQRQTAATEADLGVCSWSKRIVIPLIFAPVADSCPASSVGFTAVGSPALRRGLGQLIAGWCRGRGAVNFEYNFSSNEYLARSRFAASSGGLGSATDVALVTQPADPATAGDKRFVYAPIANDAVAIPYQIDNPRTGRPIDDLRLNARLVAKLLTQSYSPGAWDCRLQRQPNGKPQPYCATTVNGNPNSIFDDPEFQALNFRADHPDRSSFPDETNNNGTFFPAVVSGDSDMTYELTRWVVSDPDARGFLQGRPDLFGMRLNTSYLPDRFQRARDETIYPTSAFQPLDPGWNAPKKPYDGDGNDPRYRQGFQGSWNPIGSLEAVATNLVGNRSTATNLQGECDPQTNPGCLQGATSPTIPVQFKKTPAASVGLRDLTAVTDNTDAQSYRFPTAQLVTRTGAAVGPTNASMSRALATMRTNPDKVTQYVDHNTSPGNAYPLTLPVYAMVPTCGVAKTKAKAIAAMLRRVTTSQSYGLAPGTLTPGLVKLTSKQLAQTRTAATEVSSRSCVTAPADTTNAGAPMRNTGGTRGSRPAANNPAPAPTPAPSTTAPAPTTAPVPSASPAPSSVAAKNAGYAIDDDPGSIAVLLPVLLGIGAAALLGSPAVWWLAATPAGRAALNRLRPRR